MQLPRAPREVAYMRANSASSTTPDVDAVRIHYSNVSRLFRDAAAAAAGSILFTETNPGGSRRPFRAIAALRHLEAAL